MLLKKCKGKMLTVLVAIIFVVSSIGVLSSEAKASVVDDSWNKLDSLYYYSLDNAGIAHIDNAMDRWSKLSQSELEYILEPLLSQQATIQRLQDNNVDKKAVLEAIKDLGILIYTDQPNRPTDLMNYKVKHYAAFKALFGNDVKADDVFLTLNAMYDGMPTAYKDFVEKYPFEFLLLVEGSNQDWVNKIPTFVKLSLTNARSMNTKIDQAFTRLNWTDNSLIEAEKRFAAAIDPTGKAQMTSMMAVMRKSISLAGTHGALLESPEANNIRGTIKVTGKQPGINLPLNIKVIFMGQDYERLEEMAKIFGVSFAKWNSSDQNVVKVDSNGKLVAVGKGKALMTWYRLSKVPAENGLSEAWLYKFYVQVE